MKIFLVLILLIAMSCKDEKPTQVPDLGTDKPETKEELSQMPTHRLFKAEWREFLFKEIPKHKKLMEHNSSIKFWMSTFMAMVETESWFRPEHRYPEDGLGKDMVTGRQNVSEGLLQMSYQDSKLHGCEFDWSRDKHLHLGDKDKNKTIFDPFKNLACGLKVMEKQLEKRGSVITKKKPYYWAVLHEYRKRHPEFLKARQRYLNQ